jgi:hypothetical protein
MRYSLAAAKRKLLLAIRFIALEKLSREHPFRDWPELPRCSGNLKRAMRGLFGI